MYIRLFVKASALQSKFSIKQVYNLFNIQSKALIPKYYLAFMAAFINNVYLMMNGIYVYMEKVYLFLTRCKL